MSTFDSKKEDAQYLILRRHFENLQEKVVSRRNSVLALRARITTAIQQLNQEEVELAKDEDDLTRLRALLHPDEQ